MTLTTLLLAAAPAFADAQDRQARAWAEQQVDGISQVASTLHSMQAQADDDRDILGSRCLAPLVGDVERQLQQAEQARERYLAAVDDDSDYASSTEAQRLVVLQDQAQASMSSALSCGVPLSGQRSGRPSLNLSGLYRRSSDGVTRGAWTLTAGVDLKGGWDSNPTLKATPTPSSSLTLTPRSNLSYIRGHFYGLASGESTISRYPGAPDRSETGTWDTTGYFQVTGRGLTLSVNAESQRLAARMQPWPGVQGPYAVAERQLGGGAHWGNHRHRVELDVALATQRYIGASFEQERRALPLSARYLVRDGESGVMLLGSLEPFSWQVQGGPGAPMAQGQLMQARAGVRGGGQGGLESSYGLGWIIDEGGRAQRGWVGDTEISFEVGRLGVSASHHRGFQDHWLAPVAVTHSAGGGGTLWVRSVLLHGQGEWGVEAPGSLRLRTTTGELGVSFVPTEGTTLELSGAVTQRSPLNAASEGLGYRDARVVLALRVF